MAVFLRGKMTGFYKAGTSECVRDSWRFYRSSDSKIHAIVSRRDMESMFGRFWKYSDTRINLIPVDEEQPRLGGRVQATERSFDIRTFTLNSTNYHGVYGEDFITFGQFSADVDPEDDAQLLKIMDADSEDVVDRHTFKFADQKVSYSR